MEITTRVIRYTFAASLAMALLACQRSEEASTSASAAEQPAVENPAPVAKTPVYRSARRLSSDCGVVRKLIGHQLTTFSGRGDKLWITGLHSCYSWNRATEI